MFYSNTFLARKGPLGTVWIAAHLQHKLNKKKVEETDIPSSCDYIMTSDVPIALRMSAHLLLGVVRIYSKKVDFLTHDCNEIYTRIRVMFASRQNVNLPADATCAPFNSITLPETFELDALDLGDASYFEALDNHRSSPDDITLADQVPGDSDAYVTFFFNEDIRLDLLPPEGNSDPGVDDDSGVRPMDEDVPTNLVDNGMEDFNQNLNQDNFLGDLPEFGNFPDVVNDFGPDNRIGDEAVPNAVNTFGPDNHLRGLPEVEIMRDAVNDIGPNNHPEELPEIEVMRDAVNDFGSDNLEASLGLSNHSTEQLGSSSPVKDTPVLSPMMEDVPNTGGHSLPQLHADPPSVGAFLNTTGNHNTSASPGFGLGNEAPDLAIQPTPIVNNVIPRPRQRERRHIFDEAIVLPNSFMKKILDNTTGLVVKRKEMPHSNLDIWRHNKRLRVDQCFLDSCITGVCTQLQDVFTKEYAKVPTVPAEDTHAGNNTAPIPPTEENTHVEGSGTVLDEGTVPVENANVEGTGTVPIEDSNVEGTGTVPIEDTHTDGNGTVPVDDSNQDHRSENTPAPVPENDLEIERLRDQEDQHGSSFHDFMPSPFRGDEFTPLPSTNMGSEPPTGTTNMDTEPLPTLERTYTSTEPAYSDMETPMTHFEDHFGFENSGLSGIPELQSTAEEEDLRFLDGDNTPAGFTNNESLALSVRTRAVAQYLKDQSPRTETSKNPPGNLSLNKILEGKRRKTCARMFYETLVLKSHALIDVRQEEPYGDIALLLGPLSNATF